MSTQLREQDGDASTGNAPHSSAIESDASSLTTTGKDLTDNAVPTRPNRFSVTFPILPTSKDVSPTTSSFAQPQPLTSPSDGQFLTAIAAQERRVLEIKEELQRAEAELNQLKLQWASHEAQKKRDEAKRTTRMRPVSTILPATDKDDETGSNAWMQHEMERKKMLISNAKNSSRRVFSGSKHTRALSLLPPVSNASKQAPPQHRPRGATSPVKSKGTAGMESNLPRAATTPNLGASEKKTDIKLDLAGLDKDVLLETGKKMAMDIKDGIWTFWEDLRQATVGEDMVQIIPPAHLRQKTSAQALRTPRRGGSRSRGTSRHSIDLGRRSITKSPHERRASPKKSKELQLIEMPSVDHQPSTVTEQSSKHAKTPSVAISVASSDAFDAWDDSPRASSRSSATTMSAQHSPSSKDNSPVPETSRDPLPWPNIAKFGPATLRRTASHLMSEWDKLSPPLQQDTAKTSVEAASPVVDKAKKED